MFGIDDIIGAGLKIIDKFIPDPQAKLAAQQELQKMSHEEFLAFLNSDTQITTAQIQVNQEEAKSTNWLVAGWRPFIGWVCGSAFALNFVLLPLLNFIVVASGGTEVKITLDMASLMSVLLGMLGIGGMRSWEKYKGIAR